MRWGQREAVGPRGRARLPRGSGRRFPPMPRKPAGAAAAVGGGAALRQERAAPPPARGVSGRVSERRAQDGLPRPLSGDGNGRAVLPPLLPSVPGQAAGLSGEGFPSGGNVLASSRAVAAFPAAAEGSGRLRSGAASVPLGREERRRPRPCPLPPTAAGRRELSPRSPRATVPALPCPRRALSPPGGAVPAPLRDAVWEWLWRWGWLKEAASRGLMSAMLAVAY